MRRPPRRIGEQGTIAEPHDQIGALSGLADQCGEFGSEGRHLDRLIDEGMLQPKSIRLQRETLAGLADGAAADQDLPSVHVTLSFPCR